MPVPPDHAFTEAQARAIFEEASRRQAARQTPAAPALTLAELQAVARETGLDPELVAAAAAHVASEPPETKQHRFWDVPEEIRVERVLPGTVSDALWERMVAELRRTFGQPGRAGQVGRVREWATEDAPRSSEDTTAPVRVEVIPEGDQTRVVLTQSLAGYRKGGYSLGASLPIAGLITFALVAAITGLVQWLPMALLTTLLAVLGPVLFFLLHHLAERKHRKQTEAFEVLLDRLDLIALRTAPPAAVGEAQPAPVNAPLASALDPAEDEPETQSARRRNRSRG